MNILIPMAGEGSRFVKEGYTFPKPLIDVDGKPMIVRVIENLKPLSDSARFIFLVRKEHLKAYDIEGTLKAAAGEGSIIVEVDSLTEGAACTALLAKQHIDSNRSLLIANSDQLVKFQPQNFRLIRSLIKPDGLIFTFHDTHPKWSYVKVGLFHNVTEVAEKKVISDTATCGIYFFKRGSVFVAAAERMIEKNVRVNNEFYIAPVFNEVVEHQKNTVLPFYVDEMHGLGTPEDLRTYLEAK